MKVLGCAVVLLASMACTTAATTVAPGDRWAIRVIGTDRQYVGGLILELTAETSYESCEAGTGLIVGRVVERHGFDSGTVKERVAVSLRDGRFFVDLTPGACDGAFTLSGRTNGPRASGDARAGAIAGSIPVGTFTAEKLKRPV